MHYMLVFLIVNSFFAIDLYAADCKSQTYKDVTFNEAQSVFTPYDRIFLQIDCEKLKKGNHILLVNWIHNRTGIVRSDQHTFTAETSGVLHTAYFWFKLTRRGPIASTLTNEDFYPGHLGEWIAEAVIEDKVVSTSSFTLEEH